MPRWGIRFDDGLTEPLRIEAARRGISGNALVNLACNELLKRAKRRPAAALKELGIDFEELWVAYRSFLTPGKTSAKTESARRLLAFVKAHKATQEELVAAFLFYLGGTDEKYRREMQYCISKNLEDALEQVRAPEPEPEEEEPIDPDWQRKFDLDGERDQLETLLWLKEHGPDRFGKSWSQESEDSMRQRIKELES